MSAWHPVCLSADLAPGEASGTRLLGREIALWRDAAGRAHAWEDRCPHRGMRLSFGFVRGDRLACLYHGWRFDAEGRCRAIPAHPELSPPSTIRVARHACAEAQGVVWATAEPVEEAPAPPADAPAQPVRSVTLGCGADAARDLLLRGWPAGMPELVLHLQALSATETALHALRLGDPLPAAELIRAARALVALRRLAEAAP